MANKNNKSNKPSNEGGEEKKEAKLVSVTFKKNCTPYVKGDIAGLTRKQADHLIEKDIAEEN